MVRTGLIALVLAAPALVGACKGNSKPAAKQPATKVEEPPPPEPRIPSGEAHVTLPTIDTKLGRHVGTATAFVAIAKDGALTQGKVGTSGDPYAGKPVEATGGLDEQVFGTTAAPPPPPPNQNDPPPDDFGLGDPQAARQQAIDAARRTGILGTLSSTQSTIYGEFDSANGALDALVLADREAPAEKAVAALAQLAKHKTGLAVEGGTAPDAVQFRFVTAPASPESAMGYITFYDSDLSITRPDSRGGANLPLSAGAALDTATIAATLRPSAMTPMTGEVTVQLAHTTTVQQLADVLGVLASIGAPRVLISTVPEYGEGAFGSLTGSGDITDGSGDINGGFGYGTNGLGTIGTNSGTGIGGGTPPSVRIGSPSSVGDLDKAIIRRYIKRNIQKITYCYEKRLIDQPDLKGTVKAKFFISPDGYVAESTADGMDDEVATCVATVIEAIEFPKPKGGGGVQVSYPFTFRPGP